MGRKRIKKLTEIIITLDGKIVKIPIKKKMKYYEDKKADYEGDNPVIEDNIDFMEEKESKTHDSEKSSKKQDIPNLTPNTNEFAMDIFENMSENEYETFLNDFDDYFTMF